MGLREERQKAKISQRVLAERSGVHIRMVQYYEQGRKNINNAKPISIYNLANALNVPAYKIVTDEELIRAMKKERRKVKNAKSKRY